MINKQELVDAIAKKTALKKKDMEAFLNAYIETVIERLGKGDKIQTIGFGTFETRKRAAREGRNPQTGELIHIAEATIPVFKPSKILKEAVKK